MVSPRRESYLGLLANLVGVLLALGAVGFFGLHRSAPKPPPVLAPVAQEEPAGEEPAPPTPAPLPRPAPPTLDRAAVARAEAELESARRERRAAEARAAEAGAALDSAAKEEAAALASVRSLSGKIRHPGARVTSALARGGRLKTERDKLKSELAALDGTPKPRPKPLIDKSPVARITEGEETHFEIRGDRIAFIDLERLLDRVKSDARTRIRLGGAQRIIDATVGPVGSFSIRYLMVRDTGGDALSDVLRDRVAFNLQAWEIVPESDRRGETYEMTLHPASDFARTVHRLNPAKSTVTVWVYPDGFPLYRKLRDQLHARGFLVAGRPMPEAMPIRGSPAGSLSAGQ